MARLFRVYSRGLCRQSSLCQSRATLHLNNPNPRRDYLSGSTPRPALSTTKLLGAGGLGALGVRDLYRV